MPPSGVLRQPGDPQLRPDAAATRAQKRTRQRWLNRWFNSALLAVMARPNLRFSHLSCALFLYSALCPLQGRWTRRRATSPPHTVMTHVVAFLRYAFTLLEAQPPVYDGRRPWMTPCNLTSSSVASLLAVARAELLRACCPLCDHSAMPAPLRLFPPAAAAQIGRASCRERVYVLV